MATITWAGSLAGGIYSWSLGSNWTGGVAPSTSDTADLRANWTGPTTIFLTAPTVLSAVLFEDTASPDIGLTISNNSTAANTLRLTASLSTIAPTGTAPLTISANLTGSDAINVSGSGSVILSGDNSGFSGTIQPWGTVVVGSTSALGTYRLFSNSSGTLSSNAAFTLSTSPEIIISASTFTYSSLFNLTTASGSLMSVADGITINVASSGTLRHNGFLRRYTIFETSITKSGTGIFIYAPPYVDTDSQRFTSAITVDQGVMSLGVNSVFDTGFPQGTITVNNAGILGISGTPAVSVRRQLVLAGSGSTVNLFGSSISAGAAAWTFDSITVSTTSIVEAQSQSVSLNTAPAGSMLLTGGLVARGGRGERNTFNAVNILSPLTGAGTFETRRYTTSGTPLEASAVLSGTNTNTGTYSVTASGDLLFAKRAAFYNGDTSKWIAGNVSLSGATNTALSFRMGAADEFTSSDIDLIRTNIVSSASFPANSRLGLYSASDFTYASNITDAGASQNDALRLSIGFQDGRDNSFSVFYLTGTNTYSGGTYIAGGKVLKVDSDQNLGATSGAINFQSNGLTGYPFLETTGTFATARSFTVGGDFIGFMPTTGTTFTINPTSIPAASSLVKSGGGTLAFSGSGSKPFARVLTSNLRIVSGAVGTIDLVNSSIYGTSTGTGTSSPIFAPQNLTITASGTGYIGLLDKTSTTGYPFYAASSTTLTVDAPIQDLSAAAVLEISGGSTTTSLVYLKRANTFTGAVALSSGGLQVDSVSALGTGTTIYFGTSTGTLGATLRFLSASNETVTKTLSVWSGNSTHYLDVSGLGAVTFSGNIAVTNSGTKTFNLTGTGSAILSGNITEATAGTLFLAKAGAGTWRLTGTSNATNRPTVAGGVLEFSALSNLSASATTIANLFGGTLRYLGSDALTTALAMQVSSSSGIEVGGSGDLTLSTALSHQNNNAKTLTVGGTGTGVGTLVGVIANNTGVTSLTKTGTNTWVLQAANTFTGTTTISGGTLSIQNALSLQNSGLVLSGGALAFSNAITTATVASITAASSGAGFDLSLVNTTSAAVTLTLNGSTTTTFAGGITGTGSLVRSSTGTTTLTGPNTYTGTTTLLGGTLIVLTLAYNGALGGLGNTTNDPENLVLDGSSAVLAYAGAGETTDRAFTLGASGGALKAASGATGALIFNGSISFGGTTTARTLGLGGNSTFTNIYSAALTDVGGGVLSISKVDNGYWKLTGTNTYSGTTSIAAGTLSVASDANTGSNSTITFTNGLLELTTPSSSYTYTKTLSGTTGGISVPSGVSAAISSALSFSSVFTKADTGTLTVPSGSAGTLNLTGGTLEISGGTLSLTLTTAITSTTDTTVRTVGGGVLQLANASSLTNASDIGTADGTTLTVDALISGALVGVEIYLASGSGTGVVILPQDNTYGYPTIITRGVLQTNKLTSTGIASPIGTNATIFISGAASSTLRYTGPSVSIDRTVAQNSTGSLGAVEVTDPSATLTLTGSQSGSSSYSVNTYGNIRVAPSVTTNNFNSYYVRSGTLVVTKENTRPSVYNTGSTYAAYAVRGIAAGATFRLEGSGDGILSSIQTAIQLNLDGTLDLNGKFATVASFVGAGTIVNNAANTVAELDIAAATNVPAAALFTGSFVEGASSKIRLGHRAGTFTAAVASTQLFTGGLFVSVYTTGNTVYPTIYFTGALPTGSHVKSNVIGMGTFGFAGTGVQEKLTRHVALTSSNSIATLHTIAIGTEAATEAINFSKTGTNFGNSTLRVGLAPLRGSILTYSGTFTPYSPRVYSFGSRTSDSYLTERLNFAPNIGNAASGSTSVEIVGPTELSGNNTFSGGTLLGSTGTLVFTSASSGNNFGDGGLTLSTTGTLYWASGTYDVSLITGGVTFSSSNATQTSFVVPTGTTVTLAGDLGKYAAGGLTLSGGGTLQLSGNNTFGGNVSTTSSTLRISSEYALARAVLGSGTYTFGGVGGGTYRIGSLSGSVTLSVSSVPIIHLSGAPAVALSSSTYSWSGSITGFAILYKSGYYRQTVTSSTSLNPITNYCWIVTGETGFNTSPLSYNSILFLDYASNSSTISMIGTGSTSLTLGHSSFRGGGTLAVQGRIAATSTQTFASTVIGRGMSAVTHLQNSATALSINLGNLIRNEPGGSLSLTLPTTSTTTNSIRTATGTASTLLTVSGQAFITTGTDWVAKDSTNVWAVNGSSLYTASVAGTTSPGSTAIVNVTASNSTAWTTQTISALRMATSTTTLSIASGNTLTISAGGVIMAAGLTVIAGGLLTSSTGEMLFVLPQLSTSLTTPSVTSTLVDPVGSILKVTYSGVQTTSGGSNTSRITVSGGNTYTGETYITGARVSFTSGTTPFGSNAVTVHGNTGGQVLISTAVTLSNPFYISGAGYTDGSGAIHASASATLAGTVSLAGDVIIGTSSGTVLTITGSLDGGGELRRAGTGVLQISGDNYSTCRYSTSAASSAALSSIPFRFNSFSAFGVGYFTGTGYNCAIANAAGLATYITTPEVVNGTFCNISLMTSTAADNIDFSSPRCANASIGAYGGTVTYTGTYTPYTPPTAKGPAYRFGYSHGTSTLVFSQNITGPASVTLQGAEPSNQFTTNYLSLTGTTTYRGGLNFGVPTYSSGGTSGLMLALPSTNPFSVAGTGSVTTHGPSGIYFNPSTAVTNADFSVLGPRLRLVSGTWTVHTNTVGTPSNPVVLANNVGFFNVSETGGLYLYHSAGAAIRIQTQFWLSGNSVFFGPGTYVKLNHPDVFSSLIYSTSLTVISGSTTVELEQSTTLAAVSINNSTSAFSGTINLNSHTLRIRGSGTITCPITGTGGLTKSSNGSTLTLSGTHTYTGTTKVTGGVLQLAYATLSTPPAAAIISSSSPLVIGGGRLEVRGASAAASRTQTFASTTLERGCSEVLGTLNSSTTINIALGAITRNVGAALVTIPATAITTTTTNSAGTILGGWAVHNYSDFSQVSTNNIVAMSTYTPSFTSGADVSVPAGASTTGTVSINCLKYTGSGAGTLTLTGDLTVSSGGVLVPIGLGSSTLLVTGGTITSGNGTDLIVHTYSHSGTVEIASQIVGNIALTRSGGFGSAGTLRLTNGSNSYSGGTYLSGYGALRVSANGALGTGTVFLRSHWGSTNGLIQLDDGITLSNNVVADESAQGLAGAGYIHGPSTGTATFAGNLTILGPAGNGGAFATSGGTLVVTGSVVSEAVVSLRQGTLVLANAVGNNYPWFRNQQGRVVLGADNGICPTAVLDFASALASNAAMLDMEGYNQTLAGLRGTNTYQTTIANYSSTTSALTLNVPARGAAEYATGEWDTGSLLNLYGNISLVKSGAGTQILNAPNLHTAGTTITAGVLRITTGTALGLSIHLSNPVVSMSGGTLDCYDCHSVLIGNLSGSAGTITDTGLTYGDTELQLINTVSSSFAGVIADGADRQLMVFKGGGETLTLSGANTYTGRTRIVEGTLKVATETPNSLKPLPAEVEVLAGGCLQTATGADQQGRLTLNSKLTMKGGTLRIGG